MPYFALVRKGLVERVERINADVMIDADGVEQESLGQQFLADLYPGTIATDFVLTHYPVGQPDPYPRGCYAGIGFRWDGEQFSPPPAAK